MGKGLQGMHIIICRPHLLKRLSLMICKWALTSARLVRAADESPVAEEGGPGAAALEAEAVVEVRQGGLRGLCCLPSSFFFFFHFLDDGRKHGGIGNCSFIGRQLPVTLWALWFSLKRQYRQCFNLFCYMCNFSFWHIEMEYIYISSIVCQCVQNRNFLNTAFWNFYQAKNNLVSCVTKITRCGCMFSIFFFHILSFILLLFLFRFILLLFLFRYILLLFLLRFILLLFLLIFFCLFGFYFSSLDFVLSSSSNHFTMTMSLLN